MKNKKFLRRAIITSALAIVVAGAALSAQDKYSVKIPGGLAFSEFKGYENWQNVAVSQKFQLLQDCVQWILEVR